MGTQQTKVTVGDIVRMQADIKGLKAAAAKVPPVAPARFPSRLDFRLVNSLETGFWFGVGMFLAWLVISICVFVAWVVMVVVGLSSLLSSV